MLQLEAKVLDYELTVKVMLTLENNISTKICEACGDFFSCGAQNNDCWCFKFEISTENLAQLEKQFVHCLCPQCLKSFSAQAETADNPKLRSTK